MNTTELYDEDIAAEEELEQSVLSAEKFLIVMVIAIIFISVLSCFEKETGCCCCCKRSCGMIVSVNFLENKNDRGMVVCAFIIATKVLLEVMFDDILSSVPSPILRMFVRICIVGILCMYFMPMMATINMESLASQILGIIYTIYVIIGGLLHDFPFGQTLSKQQLSGFILDLIFQVPTGLYILGCYCYRIRNIRNGKGHKIEYLGNISQIRYIQGLLRSEKNDCIKKLQRKPGKAKEIMLKLYPKIHAFRFSLVILISVSMGMVVLLYLNIEIIIEVLERREEWLMLVETQRENIDKLNIPDIMSWVTSKIFKQKSRTLKPLTMLELLEDQIDMFTIGIVAAMITALLLGCIIFLHMLLCYRRNVQRLRQGFPLQHVIDFQKKSAVSIVVSSIQFGGYQVAYIVWGFVLQSTVLFLVMLVIGELLIIPLKHGNWFILQGFAEYIMPPLTTILLTMIIQHFLVKWFFLQGAKQKILALRNRKGFFNMMYFMFFYNILLGMFSCLLRLVKSAVFGLIFLPRLDRSIFPDSFEGMDSGYVAYLCLLRLEDMQSNNILRMFIYLLIHRKGARKFNYPMKKSRLMPLNAGKLSMLGRNKKAINHWFLLFTLINNPELCKLRKHYVPTVEELEEKDRFTNKKEMSNPFSISKIPRSSETRNQGIFLLNRFYFSKN